MFYVLYPFVTYLLTLPLTNGLRTHDKNWKILVLNMWNFINVIMSSVILKSWYFELKKLNLFCSKVQMFFTGGT
jgi:hypothetical protein